MESSSSDLAPPEEDCASLAGFAAGLPLRLRTEREEDLGFLIELYRSTRREEMLRAGLDPLFMQPFLDNQFALQRHHYRANYLGAGFLVIEIDAQRIGRIYIHPAVGDFRIVDICFLPQWRNAGFGGRLIGALQAYAAARGAKVSLHVDPENRAARLYQRLGFAVVDRSPPYWRLEWRAS